MARHTHARTSENTVSLSLSKRTGVREQHKQHVYLDNKRVESQTLELFTHAHIGVKLRHTKGEIGYHAQSPGVYHI